MILGVSTDDQDSHRRFREEHGLDFPLLSDEGAKVSTRYGSWGEKTLYGRKSIGMTRATFIIGPQGKLLRVWKAPAPPITARRCSRRCATSPLARSARARASRGGRWATLHNAGFERSPHSCTLRPTPRGECAPVSASPAPARSARASPRLASEPAARPQSCAGRRGRSGSPRVASSHRAFEHRRSRARPVPRKRLREGLAVPRTLRRAGSRR